MATNLAIDPELLDRALAVSGGRTKKAAVTMALQEFIERREQKRVLEWRGKLDWDASYDYKAARSRKWRSRWIRASGHLPFDVTSSLNKPECRC